MNVKKCCGTCIWHKHENIDDGWVCVNDRSEYCTDWTEYEDLCEEWEDKYGRTYGGYERTYGGAGMTINETKKALEKKHCENCSCGNYAEEKDYCNGLCEIGSAILLLNAFNRKIELQVGVRGDAE